MLQDVCSFFFAFYNRQFCSPAPRDIMMDAKTKKEENHQDTYPHPYLMDVRLQNMH